MIGIGQKVSIMVAVKKMRRIVRRHFRREWCLDLKICLGDPYKGDAVSSPQKKTVDYKSNLTSHKLSSRNQIKRKYKQK